MRGGNPVRSSSHLFMPPRSKMACRLWRSLPTRCKTSLTAARRNIARQIAAVAGKTGTSSDGWFVGFTPNLVCAVWVGFDDNEQLGLTGGEAALPIWIDFMKAALDLRPELGGKSFTQPDEVTIVEVDPDTDQLATGACPTHEAVAMLATQAPSSECYRHSTYFDAGDQPIDAVAPALIASASSPRRRHPQAWSFTQTRVDVEADGRKMLVNEMNAFGR